MLEDGATASSKCRAELDDLLGPLELRKQVKALQEFGTTYGDLQLNMATSVWARNEFFVDVELPSLQETQTKLPTQ